MVRCLVGPKKTYCPQCGREKPLTRTELRRLQLEGFGLDPDDSENWPSPETYNAGMPGPSYAYGLAVGDLWAWAYYEGYAETGDDAVDPEEMDPRTLAAYVRLLLAESHAIANKEDEMRELRVEVERLRADVKSYEKEHARLRAIITEKIDDDPWDV